MRIQFSDLKKEQLWELRQQIVLNSLFTDDYKNSFGFAPKSVQGFFDGYVEYLEELAKEDGNKTDDVFALFAQYDNADNLDDYYTCGDDYSWVEYYPEWTKKEMEEYEKYWNG